MITIPNFYFGSISYFSEIYNQNILLEKWENFPKQTYRNRCIIQGANGRLNLVVPINHSGVRVMKDIQISYDSPWQKSHQKSLQSSYQSSVYFEYYEEDLLRLMIQKEKYLFDFNLKIFEWINNKFKLNININFTEEYIKDIELDFRNSFIAKEKSSFNNQPYIQVFSDRFDFMNDLSILDLICNIGPKLSDYLNKT